VASEISIPSGIEAPGVSVRARRDLRVAALRYFDAGAVLPAALGDSLGGALPPSLQAARRRAGGRELILAWRSPTESLVLTPDAAVLESLAHEASRSPAWGCLVDQTGGIEAWEAAGPRTADLIARVGSAASMPAPGEARVSRMADVTVLALRAEEGAVLLLVERVYSEHLLGWITATVSDF